MIEALEAGVNVVVSTDGSSPDRNFDLIDQARIAAQLQRAHFADSAFLPAGKVLGMITIDAARALGMEREIGSIEVGKRADVILLNARQAHLAPDFTAPLRVIGHASGHDVDTVIVDGNDPDGEPVGRRDRRRRDPRSGRGGVRRDLGADWVWRSGCPASGYLVGGTVLLNLSYGTLRITYGVTVESEGRTRRRLGRRIRMLDDREVYRG